MLVYGCGTSHGWLDTRRHVRVARLPAKPACLAFTSASGIFRKLHERSVATLDTCMLPLYLPLPVSRKPINRHR